MDHRTFQKDVFKVGTHSAYQKTGSVPSKGGGGSSGDRRGSAAKNSEKHTKCSQIPWINQLVGPRSPDEIELKRKVSGERITRISVRKCLETRSN